MYEPDEFELDPSDIEYDIDDWDIITNEYQKQEIQDMIDTEWLRIVEESDLRRIGITPER